MTISVCLKSADMISFIKAICFDFYAHHFQSSEKKKLAIILSKGLLAFFFFFNSYSHQKKKLQKRWRNQMFNIFALFMAALWWRHVRADVQPGRSMLKRRGDRMPRLFAKGSRMKEHLLWAAERDGAQKIPNALCASGFYRRRAWHFSDFNS